MRLRQVRHSKRAVLARVEAEYEALDRVVRRLRPEDFRRPIPGFGARARVLRERWTAKDALAHIVEWKRQTWRGLARLGSDPELRGKEIAVKNRLLYERWHRKPPAAVVVFHRRVHGDVMKALRALPEKFFGGKRRSPIWPNDFVGHAAAHRRRHLEPLLD